MWAIRRSTTSPSSSSLLFRHYCPGMMMAQQRQQPLLVVSRLSFSNQTTMALEKLKAILEDYRRLHYTQEIPSRFKKEICSAAAALPDRKIICVAGLKRVLNNIGYDHNRLTLQELESIFHEIGGESNLIPIERMTKLL